MKRLIVEGRGGERVVETDEDCSVMEVLRDNDFPVLASCGGTRSCATCHVHVREPWLGMLAPRHPEEIELLSSLDSYDEVHSRLSCQINFTDQLSGMRLALPEELAVAS